MEERNVTIKTEEKNPHKINELIWDLSENLSKRSMNR